MSSGLLYAVVCDPPQKCEEIISKSRKIFCDDRDVIFPRRAIARSHSSEPVAEDGDVHQIFTPAQFDRFRRDGAFALVWTERGTNYAIPISIDQALADGKTVIIALPPCVIESARQRYPDLCVIDLASPVLADYEEEIFAGRACRIAREPQIETVLAGLGTNKTARTAA